MMITTIMTPAYRRVFDEELLLDVEVELLLTTIGVEPEATDDEVVTMGVLVVDTVVGDDIEVELLELTELVEGALLVVTDEDPMYDTLSKDCIFNEPK